MKILLIDNKEGILRSLKENLVSGPCKVAYVNQIPTALKALKKYKIDVIISVFALEKSDAIELFKAISKKYSYIVRGIVTSSKEQSVKAKNISHFCFELPLNVNHIHQAILDVADNHKTITKKHILSSVAKVKTLPSPPKVYLRLNALLSEKNVDSHKIASMIMEDPALTAKVLQFSNATYASQGQPLMSISEAITKMGLETLSYIVMTAEMFTYAPEIKGYSVENEQKHSLATAKLAASMVKPALKQRTMIAGLLHDIGKLVLFEIDEQLTHSFFRYKINQANNTLLEQKIFSTNHSHIGGYLLHTWSFSYDVIEAIVLHHSPDKLLKDEFGIAQAVYLANMVINEQEPDISFIEHFKIASVLPALEKRAQKLR